MKNIGEILSNATDSRQLQENEYINKSDELIYCSKCNTPKQMKIEILGKMLTVPIMCHCRSVEYEKTNYKKSIGKTKKKQINFMYKECINMHDKKT